MSRGPVSLVVEGPTDAVVANRLLSEAGLETGPRYVQGGKGKLDQRLAGYNNAARFSCWLVRETRQFLPHHFAAMNALYERFGWGMKRNQERSAPVIAYSSE